MALPRLVVSVVEFNVASIAKALKLEPAQITAAFQDGRGAWPFSELWGERLFEFVKHSNSNEPSSDGAVALDQLRNVNVSVKALSKAGVKFQQSKFVGYGRTTTKENLIASVEACDRVVVVDITEFPKVRFIPLDGTRLVSAVHNRKLTANGWSKARLLNWLSETYDVSEVILAI
jgi:hypothetical protein